MKEKMYNINYIMRNFNKIDIVEGIDIEFKDNFDFENDAFKNKIYRTIRAFANTNGGKLFIGINDDHEVVGIPQEKIDKISRHLCDVFKDKVELIINSKLYRNKKWYMEICISEKENFIYEDKQMKEIYIRENASLKALRGNEIIAFWDKKRNCATKINNFFYECCNKNLSIDWKYKINEMPDLNLNIDKFCSFFKSIWLNSKMIYFLSSQEILNTFLGTIIKSPIFDYNCKILEFQIDFFVPSVNSKIFSNYKILSRRLGSLIDYYAGSILFKIDKYFEIVDYYYKFDDKLLELNIQNIKRNQLRNITEINENETIKIDRTLEEKIVEINNSFEKYSMKYIVEEIKKNLK